MNWLKKLFRPPPLEPDSTPNQAPQCSLDYAQAQVVAEVARNVMSNFGRDVVVSGLSNTNSMLPMMDANALAVLERARFEDLTVGDVVRAYSPEGLPVLHRLEEQHGDKFWGRGLNNGRMDHYYVTRSNYDRRLAAIIYSKHNPTSRT